MPDDPLTQASTDGWIAEHRAAYLADGAAAHWFDSTFAGGPGKVPTLLLTTRGRRSGALSQMPLIYGEDAGRYVIVASRGGDDRHPGWFHNLRAQDAVDVQVGNAVFSASTRLATGAERTRLWQMMVALYPPFADYQASTRRAIPVIVLEPRA